MKRCRAAFSLPPEGMISIVSTVIALFIISPAWANDTVNTVPHVDLDRYLGRWYEVARLPNRFQKQCVADVTADYQRLEEGKIQVINRCLTGNGEIDEAEGVARVVDKATNAKLEVSFVSLFGWQLFWGDYWIIGLAEDYSYAVIGTPGRKYGWVLSRTPQLSEEQWVEAAQLLTESGYHLTDFLIVKTYQDDTAG